LIDGAHWVHIENPEPCNEAIIPWLADVFAGIAKEEEEEEEEGGRVVDEL